MTPDPRLSILIASHNRREMLARCLGALEAQTQDPADFEVIVADDGSSDGTAAMMEELRTPLRTRVLRFEKAGKPVVLNSAIEAARGQVCLFIDDDVIASPELVAEHLAAHQRDPRTLGIGALTQPAPPVGGDPYAQAHARRWNERYDALADAVPDWADCYGGNFSAPRAALLELGGFDAELPAIEDIELGYRLERVGCVPRFLPGAGAIHGDHKPGRRLLADEERFGSFCAGFVAERPDTRRRLLGWVNEPSIREILARRLALALRLRPSWMAAVSHLMRRRRREVWLGFVSRYAFWRGVRKGMSRAEWIQTAHGVPVLMYHAFTASGEQDRFVLSKRSFARQMRLLALLRYRAISLEELAEALREQRPLPRRSVAITIDDGYRDTFEIAAPILRKHGFTAAVFLVSERLDGENDWDSEGAVAGRPLMSLEQIARMRGEGIHFGAHTRTHSSLPAETAAGLSEQVGGSRQSLEAALGENVATLTYPYGHFDEETVAATAAAGFEAACTTEARPARLGDDPLEIPRVEIRGSDPLRRFLRKLWLGGD